MLRQSQRPAAGVNQHNQHFGFGQKFACAPDLLRQGQRGRCQAGAGRHYLQHFVDAGGLQIVDRQLADNKGGGVRAGDELLVVDTEQTQPIGAASLAPAHVTRVIGKAGKIGVLEINTHRQAVPGTFDAAR